MSGLCLGGAAADSRQRLTRLEVTSTLRHDAYMAVDYMSAYPILESVYTTVYMR